MSIPEPVRYSFEFKDPTGQPIARVIFRDLDDAAMFISGSAVIAVWERFESGAWKYSGVSKTRLGEGNKLR